MGKGGVRVKGEGNNKNVWSVKVTACFTMFV